MTVKTIEIMANVNDKRCVEFTEYSNKQGGHKISRVLALDI